MTEDESAIQDAASWQTLYRTALALAESRRAELASLRDRHAALQAERDSLECRAAMDGRAGYESAQAEGAADLALACRLLSILGPCDASRHAEATRFDAVWSAMLLVCVTEAGDDEQASEFRLCPACSSTIERVITPYMAMRAKEAA